MFLINGYKRKYLAVNDRAIQYGDGIFTTARIVNGRICLYDAHLNRLQESCKKLCIPFSKWDTLHAEICNLAKNLDRGILKIIISRGIGNRGYSTKNCIHPNRILSIFPYPHHYNYWRNVGISLVLSPVRIGRNPFLAGIKHLNRLEQVLICIHIDRSGADEALVLDSEGIIIECCTANIFWRKGYKVFTPSLYYAGVNGIMRQFCLSQLKKSSFDVIEVSTGPYALHDADEVLICNSLMPVVPVRSYRDKIWKSRELYQFLAPLCE